MPVQGGLDHPQLGQAAAWVGQAVHRYRREVEHRNRRQEGPFHRGEEDTLADAGRADPASVVATDVSSDDALASGNRGGSALNAPSSSSIVARRD